MPQIRGRYPKWIERRGGRAILLLIMVGLILAGAIRSAIATRLDSFDIDEAYHIAAGVSYLRLGDFRLNPEHPPLVKLWVAAFLSPGSFHLPPLRPLADKVEERHFTAETVYLKNDPDRVQERARIAMFVLSALLLLGFGLAVWRLFHPLVALGAIAFLVIDPTVAAHLPLVLTDLPLSLLAKWIAPKPWLDYGVFRATQPAERFGNLLIYRGMFHLREARAGRIFFRAIDVIYSRNPDLVKGERLLRDAVASAPNLYFANLELGNLLAHRGLRDEALQANRAARTSAPAGEEIVNLLSLQIERTSREDPTSVPAVRNPILE